jgi:hypothetical protein
MEQIERIEHNRVVAMGRAMLERLERGSAFRIERNDFPVEQRGIGLETAGGGSDRRIGRRQIVIVPGADLDVPTVLEQERTISIELDFVDPLLALW